MWILLISVIGAFCILAYKSHNRAIRAGLALRSIPVGSREVVQSIQNILRCGVYDAWSIKLGLEQELSGVEIIKIKNVSSSRHIILEVINSSSNVYYVRMMFGLGACSVYRDYEGTACVAVVLL